MKVAIAVEGTRGDVYPMLALAERLGRIGHETLLVGPAEFADVVAARGVAFRAAGSAVRSYLTEHAAVLHGNGPASIGAQLRFVAQAIECQYATVPDAIAAASADLVLGAGVQVAAPSAAEKVGVPYRYVMYCPAMLPSREHAPALVGVAGLPPWANRAMWALMRWVAIPALRRVIQKARQQIGLGPIRGDPVRHLFSERPLLAADAPVAPLPGDVPVRPERIGYQQDVDSDPLPEKLEQFLAAGAKPVYFGFGSMTDADPGATTDWLVAAAQQAGHRALISAGWAGLASGPLPESVMAVGAVSHPRLFPRVAAIVHHGGAGTTTAGARAGVPQLVVPHFVDQFYWRKRTLDLGVGVAAPRRWRLDVDSLALALRACRDNELLAERARELGEQLARQRDPDGDVRRVVSDGPSLWLD